MPDYNNVINNLNRKLFFKFNKIKVVPDSSGKEKNIDEFLGTGGGFGFSQHYSGDKSPGTKDSTIDVPDVSSMDTAYTTHRPHHIIPDHDLKLRQIDNKEKEYEDEEATNGSLVDLNPDDIREQDEDPGADLAPDPGAEEPPPEEDVNPEMDDPGMGDPGMGDPGMGDPGMGDPNAGMPGQPEPKSPSELGRTYEMKKIYTRLVSMNEYLADERSPKVLKTKQNIAKAIDLFAVIGANPDSYKDRIDEIIVGYYKFLEAAYKQIRSFYKAEARRVGGMSFSNNEEQKDDDTEIDVEVKKI